MNSANSVIETLSQPLFDSLPKLPQAITALLIGVLALYVFQWFIHRILVLARTPKTLVDILTSISKVVLWVIVIAAVFNALGLTQIAFALSGSVAIIGVAIGAGANSLVQDVISGLFLARDRDFNVGYRIKAGEIEGTVRNIDIRKIRIEDGKGCTHVVPNSNFDKMSWTVLER